MYMASGDLKELVNPLQKKHEHPRRQGPRLHGHRARHHRRRCGLRKDNVISLNEAVRRKERETQEAKRQGAGSPPGIGPGHAPDEPATSAGGQQGTARQGAGPDRAEEEGQPGIERHAKRRRRLASRRAQPEHRNWPPRRPPRPPRTCICRKPRISWRTKPVDGEGGYPDGVAYDALLWQ